MLYADHQFSKRFCSKLVGLCLASIDRHNAINLVAMPGAGITFFVRHLAYCSKDEFVFVNSFEMPEFNKRILYKQLAKKLGLRLRSEDEGDLQIIGEAIRNRASSGKKIVLVFNRFDRLGPILDQSFYENLHFLRHIVGDKLVLLFVTAEPVSDLVLTEVQDLVYIIDKTLYFRGYDEEDLREIFVSSGFGELGPKTFQLSGGNHALAQVLLRCQNLDNALSDPMVELLVKDIYLGRSPKRQKAIDAVAKGRFKQQDQCLLDLGYLVESKGKLKTFTPLLAEYALRQNHGHLPLREGRLLNLLKRHVGQVVKKHDIFDAVWHEDDGIASDWALNALVYRLRRHPSFDSQRYTIESHKKQGYVLHDHRNG